MSYDKYIQDLKVLRDQGRHREALALSVQRFERHQSQLPLVHICETLVTLRDFAAFAVNLDRLSAMSPNLAEIVRLKGLRAEAEGDLDAALDFWRDFAAREPTKPAPAFRVALVQIEARRFIQAHASIEDLRVRFPGHAQLGHLETRWERALRAETPDEVRTRATSLTLSQRWREALGDWELLCVLTPEESHSYFRACTCLFELARPREAWDILKSRLADLAQAKRFSPIFRRMIGMLAEDELGLHDLFDDTTLAALAPADVLAYVEAAIGQTDEDVDRLRDHLERRADPLLSVQVARRLAENGRFDLAWGLARAALDLNAGEAGRVDVDFLALSVAWRAGRLAEGRELVHRLQERPEIIIERADRALLYGVAYFNIIGRDTFLVDILAGALCSSLSSRAAIFDAVEHLLKEAQGATLAILLEASEDAPRSTREDLAFLVRALGEGGESGPGGEGAPQDSFLDHCRRLNDDDAEMFERLAEAMYARGRFLLLHHVFIAVPRTLLESPKLTRLRAQLANERRQWDLAAELWMSIANQNRYDAWAWINTTNSLINCGRLDDARSAFDTLATSNDMSTGGLKPELALLAARLGDLDKAVHMALEVSESVATNELRNHQRLTVARILSIAGLPEKAWSIYGNHGPTSIEDDHPLGLVVDPGLTVGSGHHVNYNLFAWRLMENLRGEGLDLSPAILCRDSGGEASELSRLRVVPALKFEPYAHDEMPMLHQSLQALNNCFYYDLSLVEVPGGVGFVLFHSMKAMMIEGFSRWIEDVFRDATGFVVVGLIEVDHLTEVGSVREPYVDIYLRGLGRLAANSNIGLLVYVETQAGKDFVDSLGIAGLQVRLFPYLAASLSLDHKTPTPPDPARPLTLGVVGGTRATRGSHLIPRLISRTSDLGEKCQWKIQLNLRAVSSITPDKDRIHLDRIVKQEDVSIIDAVLTAEQYYSLLDDLDVVLLPYQDRYSVSGSGVLYEAIYMGKYLVVPRNTFMPEVLLELDHPHWVLNESSVGCLESAVRHLVVRQNEIKQQLRDLRSRPPTRLPAHEFQELIAAGLLAKMSSNGGLSGKPATPRTAA